MPKSTKALLASNWNPMVAVPQSQIDQAKAGYQSTRRQELSGTGIASQYGLSWPVQQAANTAATQRGAAAAAAEAKRIASRQNYKQSTKGKKA